MRILIGCECSGVVRQAFRRLGHDAFSCDIKPAEDGSEHHLQCDIFEAIEKHGPWDFIGIHPECRYLTVSGMHWTRRGLRDPKLTEDALAFCERLWSEIKRCGRGYLENSIGILSTQSSLGRPTQIIQPWQFGEDASKATCLWLYNIPPLSPTVITPLESSMARNAGRIKRMGARTNLRHQRGARPTGRELIQGSLRQWRKNGVI